MNQINGIPPRHTPRFFQGSPVTKFFLTVSTVVFVWTQYQIQHASSTVGGSNSGNTHTFVKMNSLQQFICFSNFGEMFIGGFSLIMPLMKSFEREFGSRLFFSYLMVSVGLSLVYFECMKALMAEDPHTIDYMGPYGLMGVLLHLYYTFTPRLYPKFMGVLGMDFSEKSITYLLFCMTLPMGILPAICGFGSSMICSSNAIMPLISSRMLLPDFVYRAVNAIFGPWFVDQSAYVPVPVAVAARQINANPNTIVNNRQQSNGAPSVNNVDRFEALPMPPPPSEEAIANLTAMGFDREAVIRILQQCDNNVEIAANRLLSE